MRQGVFTSDLQQKDWYLLRFDETGYSQRNAAVASATKSFVTVD